MSKTIHMCMSVRGALNWPPKYWRSALKYVTKSDGTKFRDVRELRDALMDELANGHEVIPLSSNCDNFDFKKGCRGHETPNS